MAYLNGNMNIMRFVTRESEAPRYKGIFPLKVDSVGGEVSEWYLYGNKNGVGEKQIVNGNLPLDFVSDGTNLENYRIYGTTEGAGETKNLLEITATSTTIRGVTFTVNKTEGTITANGKASSSAYLNLLINAPSGNYYYSGCALGGSVSTYDLYSWDITIGERSKKWDGETAADSDYGGTSQEIKVNSEHLMELTIRIRSGYTCNNLVFKPMLRRAETTPDFEPFGYKIPLTVTSGTQTKDTVIPIGNTKLMAGDYIDYESGKIFKAKRIHEDTVTIDGIVWDILDYDHDEVYKADGTRAKHTVTIQTHDIVNELQYSAKQAAFAFPYGLVAGTYHFTVGAQPWFSGDVGKVLTFTLENAIPTGGQLVFNGAHNSTLVGTTISVFASATDTTAAETVTMTEGDTGTDLGTILRSKTDTINSIDHVLRGSNNWLESAMRQYLNSDKAAGSVWSPQTVFDRPPAWASTTAGFLHGIDPDFVAVLGNVKKTTWLNNISDGGGTAVHDEKFFLLSRSEVYMGDEYTGGEGTPYAYYKNYSDNQSPSTGEDKNRIKYRAGVARSWWLRSPAAGNAVTVGLVTSSGAWSNGSAVNAGGVSPTCCIILDDMDDWVKQTFYTEVTADLPAIETFNGENTLDSTETLGETTITQGYQIPLDIRNLSDTNEITINGESATVNGITYTVDKEAGTITANGTAEKNSGFMIYIYGLMGDFMFSGTPEDGSIDTYFSLIVDTMYMPCNKWDGTPLTENDYDYGVGMHEVRLDTPQANYMIIIKAGYTCDNLVFKPTLIRADVTDTTNIYVGSSPLGEGEMVSRESTNLDITLERGQSVFETTLTNKPEMIVTPDSYDKIKDMLLNTKEYDYNETQTDYIADDVTEVTQ